MSKTIQERAAVELARVGAFRAGDAAIIGIWARRGFEQQEAREPPDIVENCTPRLPWLNNIRDSRRHLAADETAARDRPACQGAMRMLVSMIPWRLPGRTRGVEHLQGLLRRTIREPQETGSEPPPSWKVSRRSIDKLPLDPLPGRKQQRGAMPRRQPPGVWSDAVVGGIVIAISRGHPRFWLLACSGASAG